MRGSSDPLFKNNKAMKNTHYMTIQIPYMGETIEVCGYYYPSTPARYYYPDGSGHPGDPAEFEIDKVYYAGGNVMPILTDEAIENIEITVLEQLEN